MNHGKSETFFNQVYQVVQRVPSGKVTTYGTIARLLGTRDARRVGWALHANKSTLVPCHRVVNQEGKLAANFAFDGSLEQRRRLELEDVAFVDLEHVDLKKHLFSFEGIENK